MADLPEQPERPKRRKRKFEVLEVPIFTELCSFCDAHWASNIKFYDVQSRGTRTKRRACEFCVFAMTLGLEGTMPPIFGARSQAEVAAAFVMQGLGLPGEQKQAPVPDQPKVQEDPPAPSKEV